MLGLDAFGVNSICSIYRALGSGICGGYSICSIILWGIGVDHWMLVVFEAFAGFVAFFGPLRRNVLVVFMGLYG